MFVSLGSGPRDIHSFNLLGSFVPVKEGPNNSPIFLSRVFHRVQFIFGFEFPANETRTRA